MIANVRMHRLLTTLSLMIAASAAPVQAGEWQTIAPGGETRCSTGTPYRFHVRQGADDRLMVFFNGGGACWSAATCDISGASGGKPTYRPFANAEAGNDPREYDGAFAVDNPQNPFRGWSQVFVSYCTGDVHLGTVDHRYERPDGSAFTIHHRGRINAQAVFDYVSANFPRLTRLFVAGSSAGAVSSPVFAAMLADRFPDADVVQFGGGGGIYRLDPPTQLWRKWGVFEQWPEIFDDSQYSAADTSLMDLYLMAHDAVPGIAYHQYDNANDGVQQQFQNMLGAPIDPLEGLNANRAFLRESLPRFRSYTAPGQFHSLLRFEVFYEQSVNGISATDWVQKIANGESVEDVHCGTAEACR